MMMLVYYMTKVKTDELGFNVVSVPPPPPPPSKKVCLKCGGRLKLKLGRYICCECGSIFLLKNGEIVYAV